MRLVIAVLTLLLVAPAAADTMGLFFSDFSFDEEAARVTTAVGSPFTAYIVLLDGTPSTVGAYEVGISFSSSTVSALAATGPNGWTNFGSILNHRVGYTSPLPVSSGGTVLGTLSLMQLDGAVVDVEFGPSSPSSLGDGPAIVDGDDVETILTCEVFGGGPVVASLNRPPAERREVPLSQVKSLFQ